LEGGRHKERGNEGEYDRYMLYPYMKIEEQNLLKLFEEGGWGERGRMIGGVNLTKIYCKHICKCQNVSPCTTIIF
jgi:hypothetical protein